MTPIQALRRVIAAEGSQAGAARALDVSPTYISLLLNKKTKMSAPMLTRLGYDRRIVIERKR